MSATGRGGYRPRGEYYTPLPVAKAIVAPWAREFAAYPAAGRYHGRVLRTLDASAGGGAFPIAMMHHDLIRPGSFEVMDLNGDARALSLPGGFLRTVATVTADPVLTGFIVTDPQQRPDLVIGNPPFGVPRPPEPCPRCEDGKITVTKSHRSLHKKGHAPGSKATCPKCRGAGELTFKRAIPVAQEHIERALEVSDRYVLFLLRLAMLESDTRIEMWEGTPLRHVDILVRRPEFMAVCTICAGTGLGAVPGCCIPSPCEACEGTGKIEGQGGGDASAYGAFLWDHHFTGSPTIGWI